MKWRRQDAPQMPGFCDYTLDIVSPELPCGASWLGNFLLELRVPMWHPWGADTADEWEWLGADRFRYQRRDEGWRRLLPALTHGREFSFCEHPTPRLGHHWPGHYAPLPAILVVRDPRDSLYSAWRRERALGNLGSEIDFCAFTDAPFRNAPTTWSAYFALHLAAWHARIRISGGLVLRFEDFKHNPLLEAQRVLRFLSINASAATLKRALDASTHAAIARAESELLANGTVPSALLAGGIADEWRTHFTPDMLAAIPDWAWARFERFGYTREYAGSPAAAPTASEIQNLLDFLEVPKGANRAQ